MIYIEGTLKEMPVFSYTGGDFRYYYMVFKLNGVEENFIVENCAYDELDIAKARMMSPGDSLVIGTLSDEEEQHIVISLSSDKQGILIDFENYRFCDVSGWRKPFYASIFLLGVALFEIARRYFKSKR